MRSALQHSNGIHHSAFSGWHLASTTKATESYSPAGDSATAENGLKVGFSHPCDVGSRCLYNYDHFPFTYDADTTYNVCNLRRSSNVSLCWSTLRSGAANKEGLLRYVDPVASGALPLYFFVVVLDYNRQMERP